MSAPVTFDDGTPILDPLELRPEWCALPGEGDAHTPRAALKRATPGTLWERVAEAPAPSPLAPQYSARLIDATLNAYKAAGQREAIREVRRMQGYRAEYGPQGPRAYVGGIYTHPWSAHGIFEGRVRVK